MCFKDFQLIKPKKRPDFSWNDWMWKRDSYISMKTAVFSSKWQSPNRKRVIEYITLYRNNDDWKKKTVRFRFSVPVHNIKCIMSSVVICSHQPFASFFYCFKYTYIYWYLFDSTFPKLPAAKSCILPHFQDSLHSTVYSYFHFLASTQCRTEASLKIRL